MGNWYDDTDRGKQNYAQRNPSQCHVAHNKSNRVWDRDWASVVSTVTNHLNRSFMRSYVFRVVTPFMSTNS